jgi:hypothetical protein
MPKTGRPAMTDDQVRSRISDYCARYGVKELNDEGFPIFPAGLRETKQHREWITLYKLFSRLRARSGVPRGSRRREDASGATCPVCLQPLAKAARPHPRCVNALELVRELGMPGLDRIRAAAFPEDAASVGRAAGKRRDS